MSIFDLIKNKEFDILIKKIENDEITELNIKDSNNNYFIHYVINYNQLELLNVCLSKNINIDIFDSSKKTILYIPLKFNYIEICKSLIEYNNKCIGLSFINQVDMDGENSVHYAILFNNYEIFSLLIENGIEYTENNPIFYTIIHNRINMLKLIIEKKFKLDVYTKYHESLLQVAINYNNDFIDLLLEQKINLKNQDSEYGLTILHQCVINNNLELFEKLLLFDVDINCQDYYGNTILHYIFIEKHYHYLKSIMKYNILFNLSNSNGDIPLHILLNTMNASETLNEYIKTFLENSDLNNQNNSGVTCLMLIVRNNLLPVFYDILVNCNLNFFIKDNNNNGILINDEIIELTAESYYNQLLKNKNKLKWCDNNIDKINLKEICKNKIKKIIKEDNTKLPQLHLLDLKLDYGIYVNTCYYTGFPIDILFGLLLLKQDFPDIGLILDYPLIINQELEEHYKQIGTYYPYTQEFCNIEIIWSYQKLLFPSYFDSIIKKQIKLYKYITIPIGIELSNGAHANIIFIDNINKTIERFEPNGSNTPIGFNYNPILLDTKLKERFNILFIDYKYIFPSDFLPVIGFQTLENIETNACKHLGDPNGFCGVWSTWWIYQRMLNIKNIKIESLALELIKIIKFDNQKFKMIIRNFSNKITELRDSYLSKYDLDINKWIVGKYTKEDIHNIEKDILQLL